MATKTISGTITGGYTLGGGYSTLSITSTGEIIGRPGGSPATAGGAGLTVTSAATVEGAGAIVGGAGYNSVLVAAAGGAGVYLGAGKSLTSTLAAITGGVGGDSNYARGTAGVGGAGVYLGAGANLIFAAGMITGGEGGVDPNGGVGGAGGVGVALKSGSNLTITAGTIIGGAGYNTGFSFAFAGGAGVALALGSSLTMTAGSITGGAGVVDAFYAGAGGAGILLGERANLTMTAGMITGGAGGVGILAYSSLTTVGTITGGAGGNGNRYDTYGASGGNGVVAGASLTTTGTIIGGAGGAGGVRGGDGGVGVRADSGTNLTAMAGTITGGAGGGGPHGGAGGVGVFLGIGTLVNLAGTITGGAGGGSTSGANGLAGDGVYVFFPATVINGDSSHHAALISGGIGISLSSVGTVTNFATIVGTGGTSVAFTYAQDRLIIESGAVFIGAVSGGGGALELASTTGTIAGLCATGKVSGAETMTFRGFGSYDFDAGASWILAGTDALAAGQTLINTGTLTGTLGLAAASARVVLETGGVFRGIVHGGGGTLELAGGSGTITGLGATAIVSGADAGTFSGIGSYVIDGGGSWTLAGTDVLAAGQTLANAGTLAGTLGLGSASAGVILETGGVFSGVVNGGGGTLELAGGTVGTITGLGSQGTLSGMEAMTFSGFGSYDVAAGASWALAGIDLLAARQTLANAGTVVGTLGLGAASDRVILETGGVFQGIVNGGDGALELAGGTGIITGLGGTATVSGAGAGTFSGFGAYDIDAGASWTLEGTSVLAAGHTMVNGGTLAVDGAGTLTNAGVIVGPVVVETLGSSGATLIAKAGSSITGLVTSGTGTLELAGGSGTITGLGSTGTVSGADAMTFSGFGYFIIGAGGSWTLTGIDSLMYYQQLTNAGSLVVGDGAEVSFDSIYYHALTNTGSVTIGNGGKLHAEGTIENSGTISLAAKNVAARLIVDKTDLTLSGGGSVILGPDALNTIIGSTTAATLTNADNTISGSGLIGHAKMQLINEAAGAIDQTGTVALIIDTGANTIANAGFIESLGAGGLVVQSAVDNAGRLEVYGGTMTVNGVVTGSGLGVIAGGRLDFTSSFNERVQFLRPTGVLELAQSQNYTGAVFGFSKAGGTSLDLRDIGFVGSGEATYSGTTARGVLTVTDGTHTAKITFVGDYTTSTWTASSDGGGGVIVTDPATPGSPHAFAAAMAGMGPNASATAPPLSPAATSPPSVLAQPMI